MMNMKRMMEKNTKRSLHMPALGAFLFLFWLLLNGDAGQRTLLTGVAAVFVTLAFYRRFLMYFNLEPILAMRFFSVARFAMRVVVDIFASAWHHMKRVIKGKASPELFELTLSIKEPFMIALIANAITLTPGSMTVEVNGSKLLVLAFIDGEEEIEAFRTQIFNRYESVLKGGRMNA
jgi:multicomponent Na+:H+ antiporter subunit E